MAKFPTRTVPAAYADVEPEQLLTIIPHENETKFERLVRCLRLATWMAETYRNEPDGGTCNFDAPTLDYKAYGTTKAKAKEAVEAVGLHCRDWYGHLVITGFQRGQGALHTDMAEAFSAMLDAQGIPTGMYYQMD